MIHCATVIAFVEEGDIYCPDCAETPRYMHPLFAEEVYANGLDPYCVCCDSVYSRDWGDWIAEGGIE